MKKTALILLATLTLANADFSRSTAGVVTDTKTKLEWQDDYSANNDANGGNLGIKSAYWSDALTYCHDLQLDFQEDNRWRLPNINELKSLIVDKVAPTIDGEFKNTASSHYWSATSLAHNSRLAWYINFNNAIIHYNLNNNNITKSYYKGYVRCVRAGQ